MNHGFGIESHHQQAGTPHREPARYLVVIESAGSMVARLFLENRAEVGEVDAGSEEVAMMTKGLKPEQSAGNADWNAALEAHSADERAPADVYTLDL